MLQSKKQLANMVRNAIGKIYFYTFLPFQHRRLLKKINKLIQTGTLPKIAMVKQDVHDDLYCCHPGSSPKEIVGSTILRSGPVALFSRLNADFYVLNTEDDPECNIWKEKWTTCRWCPLEYFEAFRNKVPGRSYGNRAFSQSATNVDWSQYDIVISADVSVPARITRKYSDVAWSYYVREIKTPAYGQSRKQAIFGQDIHLNHHFRLMRPSGDLASHEVDFPYHLHYVGCFHELFGIPFNEHGHQGVFLEHHTGKVMKPAEIKKLMPFGPVISTAFDPPGISIDKAQRPIRRTLDPEYLPYLLHSKYFLKLGGRSTWGTAIVEAIAAGSLALGTDILVGNSFLFSRHTRVSDLDDVLKKIARLEFDDVLYQRELKKQRLMVNYLCFSRPTWQLLEKANQVIKNRHEEIKPSQVINDNAKVRSSGEGD